MVTREAWLTQLFNEHLAGLGNGLLALFGQKAPDPNAPWADFIVMQVLVVLIIMAGIALLKGTLSVRKPGTAQHLFELIHSFIGGQADDQVGHDGHKHITIFETLFLFVLVANLIGIIPMFVSPTQVPYVPCGCALVTFFYYHYVGVRQQGLGHYLKSFMGPIWWLAPLMIPIEIISHLVRPLSLTVRLFANMYAGEQVTLVFLSLTFLAVPAIFMGLHVFVSFLQAYIFVLMTMMYVAGAVSEEH